MQLPEVNKGCIAVPESRADARELYRVMLYCAPINQRSCGLRLNRISGEAQPHSLAWNCCMIISTTSNLVEAASGAV